MKRSLLAMLLIAASGCTHLLGAGTDPRERSRLWADAQEALHLGDFAAAEAGFSELARRHEATLEGRESLFYLGTIRLDPRNPEWDSERAEESLARYIDLAEPPQPRLYRFPEATTLHEIARQLNMPPEARVGPLQPEERVVRVEERVFVPVEESREMAAEVERLRQQVAERDARIAQQQQELERIRRTITGPGRQ